LSRSVNERIIDGTSLDRSVEQGAEDLVVIGWREVGQWEI